MSTSRKRSILIVIMLCIALSLVWADVNTQAFETTSVAWITGSLYEKQNQPVADTRIVLIGGEEEIELAEAITQEDGRYTVEIPEDLPEPLTIHIERSHFKGHTLTLSSGIVESIRIGKPMSSAKGRPAINPVDFEGFVQDIKKNFGIKVHTVEIKLDE